ncbi:hypothetical protein C9374_013225 [Naegleria lovaniensis]|uniref:FZ domain-containing protein n=1 Tax=Naegleria lovaniensis TaxID=51637 RepID=A0AA88GYV9_NAELO|nr:uncharacterized protein C9374_013225 [Naegleria lovaniensis]KAG2391740.1 hypothetical protein C9374_013225 [Naegleria lovaniensis]
MLPKKRFFFSSTTRSQHPLSHHTLMFSTLFTTFLIIFLSTSTQAQVSTSTCSGSCMAVSDVLANSAIKSGLTMCQNYLPKSQYVCITRNYTSDDLALQNNFLKNSKFLPDDASCISSWKSFACMRVFASCYPTNKTVLPVCYSDCLTYTENCWNRDRGYNPFNWFYQGVFFLNPDLDLKFKYFCAKNSAGLLGQSGDVIDYNASPNPYCTTSTGASLVTLMNSSVTLIMAFIILALTI